MKRRTGSTGGENRPISGIPQRRHSLLLSIILACALSVSGLGLAQSEGSVEAQFAWLAGSKEENAAGTYGAKGTPAPDNTPGSRSGAMAWTGKDGGLYLFGGSGSSFENDLWKYDPTSRQWTWLNGSSSGGQYGEYGVQGNPDPDNGPGGRWQGSTWIDAGGDLYLFGGQGLGDSGASPLDEMLDDVWRYNIESGEWTWLAGSAQSGRPAIYGTQGIADPANTPGGRVGAMAWTGADGKFYLFGGLLKDAEFHSFFLGDLWRFDPASRQWTWLRGPAGFDQPGFYGTKGVADPACHPGARIHGESWIGDDGSLYLFGGLGWDGAGSAYYQYLSDLWKYNPAENQWTWVSGATAGNQPAHFGLQGVPNPANDPGARSSACAWKATDGSFYLFGGNPARGVGFTSDLWRYDPAGGLWTWLKGPRDINQIGIYGTQFEPDAANLPGARAGASAWTGNDGRFYLFGGSGYGESSPGGALNDLWSYLPTPDPLAPPGPNAAGRWRLYR